MIISNKEALERLASPLNLINRMKKLDKPKNPMSLFTGDSSKKSSLPEPSDVCKQDIIGSDTLVDDNPPQAPTPLTTDMILGEVDSKIKLALAHDKAVNIMDIALDSLKNQIDDIKPSQLPNVIAKVSKMVEGIRKERIELNKSRNDREVHLHFYTPVQKQLTDYDIIEVG
jgi:hypothetical protein